MTIQTITPIIAVRDLTGPVIAPGAVTVDTVVQMPSAANMIGKTYTIINPVTSTANLLVQASDGSLIRTVYPGCPGQITPNTDAPTTASQWEGLNKVVSGTKTFTMSIFGVTTNPTRGSVAQEDAFWSRDGEFVEYTWSYRQSGAGTAGSGIYYFGLPANLAPNYVRAAGVSGASIPCAVGSGFMGDSNYANLTPLLGGSTSPFPNAVVLGLAGSGTSNAEMLNSALSGYSLADASASYSFTARIPISGWSATKG